MSYEFVDKVHLLDSVWMLRDNFECYAFEQFEFRTSNVDSDIIR